MVTNFLKTLLAYFLMLLLGEFLKTLNNFLEVMPMIFIILIISLPVAIIFLVVRDYFSQKYKNESPEDKKKREELEKIREWSQRNKC